MRCLISSIRKSTTLTTSRLPFILIPSTRKWALALGTPVLVVAGFGHVLAVLSHKAAKKFQVRREERRLSRSVSRNGSGDLTNEKTDTSSATSVREAEQRSRSSSTRPFSTKALLSNNVTFEIDVGGNDEVISKWPSFVRMENGKALIQATMRREGLDLEAQRPGPSGGK